jgi:hypothetical protein
MQKCIAGINCQTHNENLVLLQNLGTTLWFVDSEQWTGGINYEFRIPDPSLLANDIVIEPNIVVKSVRRLKPAHQQFRFQS